MYLKYEEAYFKIGWQGSIDRWLIKQSIKKRIGKFLGKPYQLDTYLKFASQHLSHSSIVVDVGSNIGTTVLPLAVKFPNAKFFAIEPHPIPAAKFINNCERNHVKNVSLVSTAIGLGSKMAQIYTCPTNSGGHRLTGFRGRKDIVSSTTFGPIKVPMKSLHDLFNDFEIEHCDLLKIDTEGYEIFVLESLKENLHPEIIPYVVAEMGPEGLRNAGKSPWELVSLMLKKGYICRILGTERVIENEEDVPLLPDFTVIDLLFSKRLS